MHLKTIKTAKETGIEGIEFVTVDKTVTEVVIGKLHIRKGETYTKGLEIVLEQPFDEAQRYRMTATIEGFRPVISFHETEYDARAAGADFPSAAVIDVSEVTVLVDEEGEVVFADNGEAAIVGGARAGDDDMPF